MRRLILTGMLLAVLLGQGGVCLATYSAPAADSDSIGTITTGDMSALSIENIGSEEALMGLLAADAQRAATGADIAIANSGDIAAGLSYGDITADKLYECFPVERELAVGEVTGAQLKEILEAALSSIVLTAEEKIDRAQSDYGGFPQISGFTLYYDIARPPGQRVISAERMDGEPIDLTGSERTYTLAATTYMLSGGWGLPQIDHTASGVTLLGAVEEYISVQGKIDGIDSRMTYRGAIGENSILDGSFSLSAIAVAAVFFGLAGVLSKKAQPLRTRLDEQPVEWAK